MATPDTLVREGAPRGRLKGTPQQEAFWDALLDGSQGNILLEARAGTGKSTSCREGMHRLLDDDPSLAIRYCCFNRKIAEEFGAKCPDGVEVGTMHRFGFQALAQAFGSQLQKNKTYTLLDGLSGSPEKRYLRKAIAQVVGMAKNVGLDPEDPYLRRKLNALVAEYDIEVWKQRRLVVDWAIRTLKRSAEVVEIVDFDDMIWLAALHEVPMPTVDFVFIDECQDLNPIQHKFASLLVRGGGRLIAVGDPYQAIYGFRGADSDSIPKLRRAFGMTVLPLTVTFRCPRSHVQLARQLVEDFVAAPDAPEGVLRDYGDNADILDGSAPGELVLCRTNAPLISACLRAIAARKPAVVRGRAMADQLGTIHRAVVDSASGPTIGAYAKALDEWHAGQVEALADRDGTEDQIEALADKWACLGAVASSCSSPREIPDVLSRLFDDSDSDNLVTFSTVHRAKGSEARKVTYLQVPYGTKRDKAKPPQQWELDQRRNLRYVALTRSLDTLRLVAPKRP